MVTVGGVVSLNVTVKLAVAVLPAASRTVTVSTFVPSWSAIPLAVQLVVPVAVPLPVTSREMLSPSAVKFTFAVAVADVVGVKRTVTAWVAPTPTSVNGLPETILKGPEVDAVPETVPPTVFCPVKV